MTSRPALSMSHALVLELAQELRTSGSMRQRFIEDPGALLRARGGPPLRNGLVEGLQQKTSEVCTWVAVCVAVAGVAVGAVFAAAAVDTAYYLRACWNEVHGCWAYPTTLDSTSGYGLASRGGLL